MKASLRRRDCDTIWWKQGEKAKAWVVSAAAMGFLAYFFYRSPYAMPALVPVGVYCYRNLRKRKRERYRQELTSQFRECILAVAAALQAGYCAENAFVECGRDMKMMYGQNAVICKELEQIRRGLAVNITLEELLSDFAARNGCEEIDQFAQIFSLAKRNGGNMAAIIKNSAALIGRKIEQRQEILTLLSGRRMELNIMKIMPFGILAYVGLGNPGYFVPLYGNLAGVGIMTGCLGVYLAAFALAERVMDHMTVSG